MKLSKRQLKRLIREEKSKLLQEWGERIETGSVWIDFARTYAGLGNAVQDQVDAIVGAYINGGGPDSENFRETVYQQNPNAIDMAIQKLQHSLRGAGDEAEEILEALELAQDIYITGEMEDDTDPGGDRR